MSKEIWEEYPHIWATEAAFMSFLRGGIRRYVWSKNPVKLEFEKEATVKIPNDNPKSMKKFPMVNGYECAHCKGLFKSKDVQCDHKVGEYSLRSISDIQSFVEGIALVRKTDLQMLCVSCHATKTLAERQGLTLEEAAIEKQVIEMDKKKAQIVIDFLIRNGYNPARKKEDRKIQLRDYFTKESNK
ncbi:putative HNH endonuclease protein [Pseudomonas phage vB_PpS_SYP]|nr:putative HNH endonuclease protein [Pseudomonas phage vB_PpS_SYP]